MENITAAPVLVRTYHVKLAYGRDLYGHRAIVRWPDGREEDMRNSDYLKLVDRAAPKDVNKFYPNAKVGGFALVMFSREGGSVCAIITKVTKSTIWAAPVHLNNVQGEAAKVDSIYHFYAEERLCRAVIEASERADYLKADSEFKAIWQAWLDTKPNLSERPAHVQAAQDAQHAIQKEIAARYNLNWRECDEVFGY